jgi:hypothetical protein
MGSLRDLHSKVEDLSPPSLPTSDDKIQSLIVRLLSLTYAGTITWEVDAYSIYRYQRMNFMWKTEYMNYEFYLTEEPPGEPEELIVVEGNLKSRQGMKKYQGKIIAGFQPAKELLSEVIRQTGFERDLDEEKFFKMVGIS